MTRRSDSTIVRVDGFEVSCRLAEPFGNALRFFDTRSSLLVSVTTAGGTVGWGETWASPGAAAAMIQGVFGRQLDFLLTVEG